MAHAKLEPGRAYRGRVVVMASDAEGKAYVVVDTDPPLTAIPAVNRRLRVGQEIYARAVTQEVAGDGGSSPGSSTNLSKSSGTIGVENVERPIKLFMLVPLGSGWTRVRKGAREERF